MAIDINKHDVDIKNLKEQNENELLSIKELYKKIEELEKKIEQNKYINNKLIDKLRKDYEKFKSEILNGGF